MRVVGVWLGRAGPGECIIGRRQRHLLLEIRPTSTNSIGVAIYGDVLLLATVRPISSWIEHARSLATIFSIKHSPLALQSHKTLPFRHIILSGNIYEPS